MGLESGTYVDDLVVTNPPGTDDKRQGDDHLRLIKTVLRNTLKRASKSFFLPTTVTKTANYSVAATDDNTTVVCDTTGGAFTLTLPSLALGDAGWNLFVVKSNTGANPVFLVPSSGTINGFTQLRRAIRYATTRVSWTGSSWIATRPDGRPIGSVTSFYGSALPDGYLWCDGSSFSAPSFVELNSTLGAAATPDLRGRAEFGRDDMGGAAASRITNAAGGVAGTTLGASGGNQSKTLTTTELPAHTHGLTTSSAGGQTVSTDSQGSHTHTINITDPGHPHDVKFNQGSGGAAASVVNNIVSSGTFTGTAAAVSNTTGVTASAVSAGAHTHSVTTANHTHTGPTDSAGSGAAYANLPPTMICNKIMLAE